MLCAILTGPTFAELKRQYQEALPYADLLELRLDLLSEWDWDELKKWCAECELPLLFTLRKASQGGGYKKTEEERLQDIKTLLKFKPSYFDLEGEISPEFLIQQNPDISFVVSTHYFQNAHPPIEEVLAGLSDEGAYRKIAVQTPTTPEALQLLACAPAASRLSVDRNGC